jgi:dTDP-4-dehydrorhamnose reductase
MMRVLVLGGGGQVGRALASCAPEGIAVRAPTRAELDAGDEASVRASLRDFGATALVNAAAYTAVDKAESEPEIATRINADLPGALARIAAEAAIPFVHLSTDYVFSGESIAPYREADACAPLGVYGRTKRAGEIAAWRAGGRVAILRTSWVFAPWGNNFVRTMLRLAASKPELRVVDDQRGGPTSALDIADAIFRILPRLADAADKDAAGLFHFQGRPAVTWAAFAEAILDEGAKHGHPRPPVLRISTAEYPTPAARPANSVLDCARYSRVFDAAPPDWRRSLPETVERLLADTG